MIKFKFKYERVLQVRIDKENDVKNKLGKLNQLIMEKEKASELVKNQNFDFLKQVNLAMREGILASDLQAIASNKAYLTDKIVTLNHEIDLFRQEHIKVRKELIKANKERKVMDKLKEKEYEQYKELERQEEAKLVDQIVTYQSTNKRGDNHGG